MAINKQPIFTATPILVSITVDPVFAVNYNNAPALLPPTDIFVAEDSNGTLIERITVSAVGSTYSPNVTQKYVYLYIYDPTDYSYIGNDPMWTLYKSAYMPAATLEYPTLNPEIEWTFTGGLLLPRNYKLGIGASMNAAEGQNGDSLAITIEGSSYSQP
jgi:hypothetical protein